MLPTILICLYTILAAVMWKVNKASRKPVTGVLQILALGCAFGIAIGKIAQIPEVSGISLLS